MVLWVVMVVLVVVVLLWCSACFDSGDGVGGGVEGGDIIGHERGSGGLNGVGGVVDWCFGLSTATITTIMTHDHHHNHHYYHHHL